METANQVTSSRHAMDCECDDCRTAFDAAMWGWLTPAHEQIIADYWSDDPEKAGNLYA